MNVLLREKCREPPKETFSSVFVVCFSSKVPWGGSRVSLPRKVPCFHSSFITVPGFNPCELYSRDENATKNQFNLSTAHLLSWCTFTDLYHAMPCHAMRHHVMPCLHRPLSCHAGQGTFGTWPVPPSISMVDSATCPHCAECSRAPDHVTNGCGCPMQTVSCTWHQVVSVGEDPAAHSHWCTFMGLYHAMPCHAM